MKILEDLYYGRISPCERLAKRKTEAENWVKLIKRNEENLMATLNKSQKETFEKFKDYQSDLADLQELEAFTEGFSLAVKMMAECHEYDANSIIG